MTGIRRHRIPHAFPQKYKGLLAPLRRTRRLSRVQGKFCGEQRLPATATATETLSSLERETAIVPSKTDRRHLRRHLLTATVPTKTSSRAPAALLDKVLS